eukprot:g20198.t1
MDSQRQHLNATLRNISARTGTEVEQAVDAVLADSRATNVRLHRRIQQLETDRSSLTSSVCQHRLALERERADRSTQQAALEDQVGRHHTQVTNQVSLIRELEGRVLATTERAERSQEQVLSRNSQINDLSDNVAKLKTEGEELQEQLRVKVEECHGLAELIDELRKESRSLHDNVDTRRASLETVQGKLADAECELTLVRSKLESLPLECRGGVSSSGASSTGASEDVLKILENICDRSNYLVEELDEIKYNLQWYKDYHDYWVEQENPSNRTKSTWADFGTSGAASSPPASEGAAVENATGCPDLAATAPTDIVNEETSTGAGPATLPPLQLFPPLQLSEGIAPDTILTSFDAARGFLATHTPLTIEEISDAGCDPIVEQDNGENGAGDTAGQDDEEAGAGSGAVCGDCETHHPLLVSTNGQRTTAAGLAANTDLLNQSAESIHTCRSFVSTPPTGSQLALLDQDLLSQDLRPTYATSAVPTSTLLPPIFPVPGYVCPGVEERAQFGSPEGDSEHTVVGASAAGGTANTGIVDENSSGGSSSPTTSESSDTDSESDSSYRGESTDSGNEPRSRRVLKRRVRFYRRAKIAADKVIRTERSRNIDSTQEAPRQFEADKDRLCHKLRGEERRKTAFLRRRVQELSNEKNYWEERANSIAEARDCYKKRNEELLHRVADLECNLRDAGGVQGNSGWQDYWSRNDRRNWHSWGRRD